MVFHCFLIFLQKKRPIMPALMLDAPSILLCSKLCRHNVSDPKLDYSNQGLPTKFSANVTNKNLLDCQWSNCNEFLQVALVGEAVL